MLLRPKNIKFQKTQRNKLKISKRGRFITVKNAKLTFFGEFGLVALEPAFLTAVHLEISRRILKFNLPKTVKFWVFPFPHKPYTKKALGSRIGKGKGSVSFFAAPVKPGITLVEISKTPRLVAFNVFSKLAKKLPFKTKIVQKNIVS